jgi:ADP-heptose:LPS heptosyltransferase
MSRGVNRLRFLCGAVANSIFKTRSAARPPKPRKILVLHELLLGDTLMLAPLLAALRTRYKEADIFVTANPAHSGLFSGRPYGVQVLPYSERDRNAASALSMAKDCDLAFVPGEIRQAIVARAIGARWIVGFGGGTPVWRNYAVDELVSFPSTPTALADIFALLAGLPHAEEEQLRYATGDWPSPSSAHYDKPPKPFAVLHVGAGSPLRLWEPFKWLTVAEALSAQGLSVVWTSGPGEAHLVHEIDPDGRYLSLAGRLDLPQLWHLLSDARCAVTLDTGIAHMAKLTCTRVAVVFGQGSGVLFGKGRFWANNPFFEVTHPRFPCRDQRTLFQREIDWVRRCNRTVRECPRARCMEAVMAEQVVAALQVQ